MKQSTLKNYIIFFSFLFTISVNAQTVIGQTLNENFLDSLLASKINDVRVKNKVSVVYPSYKLRKYISQEHANMMVEKKTVLHPDLPETKEFNKKLLEISVDFSKANNGYQVYLNYDSTTVYHYKELTLSLCNSYTTYEELVKNVIDVWMYSKDNKEVILAEDYNPTSEKKVNQIIGVSIKRVGGGYFGSVNFISFE